MGALPSERVRGVETGGCPHAAIREDCSMNLEAIADLERTLGHVDVVFIESGGDNLAAAFSPDLADASIYVIDVAGGDKIPRKGGPGIMRSDLLVINKIDLAPYVGASLEVMDRDARRMRGARPFVFTNLKSDEGLDAVVDWALEQIKCLVVNCSRLQPIDVLANTFIAIEISLRNDTVAEVRYSAEWFEGRLAEYRRKRHPTEKRLNPSAPGNTRI